MRAQERRIELTDVLGRRAVLPAGQSPGRIADLAVRIGAAHPGVCAVSVGPRRDVLRVERIELTLSGQVSIGPGEPGDGDDVLWLARDVLDSQIFDVAGRRITRVADVELAIADGTLELLGVDVGAAPLLRRLGLSRLAGRAGSVRIPWEELHLLSEHGHALQLETPGARVHSLSAHQLAELAVRVDPDRAEELLARVDAATAARAARLIDRHPRARPRHRYGHVLRLRRRAPA